MGRRWPSRNFAGDLGFWKFPDQVVRLAILLIGVGVVLVVVRGRLIPPSFGELGHFRPEAIPANMDHEIRYGGWQLCADCHDDIVATRSTSFHRTVSCEVCHGPSFEHADELEVMPHIPTERGDACLYCHSYLPSRPTGFPQILEAEHNPLDACTICHDPHDPTPPEVPQNCSACHGEIARTKSLSPHRALACETCHEALPEHREHPRAHLPTKPTTREFCKQCHAEGADSPSAIPRVEELHGGSYTCWQCHYPHFPES